MGRRSRKEGVESAAAGPSRPAISPLAMTFQGVKKSSDTGALKHLCKHMITSHAVQGEHMISGHMHKSGESGEGLTSPPLPDHEDAQSGGEDEAPDADPFEWMEWMEGGKWVTWVAGWWVWHGCLLCFSQMRLYLATLHGQLSSSADADTVSRMLMWSVAVALCDLVCMISGLAVLILNLRLLCSTCVGAACKALAMVVACGISMVPVIGAQSGPACWHWKVGYP